jgi:hypothetical protein
MANTDLEWQNFLMGIETPYEEIDVKTHSKEVPICSDLYISTKTKVLYLNQIIDIYKIFWLIPIVEYWERKEGVTKKQIKIVSKSKDELEEYNKKLINTVYYRDYIIKQIDNPAARRIKFKDERKLTIGLSKKDIMNCRSKQKQAFYNCFAMILRFESCGEYKEVHVKVFNTGKLEIPGILNDNLLITAQRMILEILQPHISTPLFYTQKDRSDENVLINSNYNCGFYMNREKALKILKGEKYGIEATSDSCTYPGVKCKFYFNNDKGFSLDEQNGRITSEDRQLKMSELIDSKNYTKVSFALFRTGSGLISGNCSEKMLIFVFEYIKLFLKQEYKNINVANEGPVSKSKKVKIRKRIVQMSSEYFRDIFGI